MRIWIGKAYDSKHSTLEEEILILDTLYIMPKSPDLDFPHWDNHLPGSL